MITGWPMGEAQNTPPVFKIIIQTTLMPAESPVPVCLTKGKTQGRKDGAILISRGGARVCRRGPGLTDQGRPRHGPLWCWSSMT